MNDQPQKQAENDREMKPMFNVPNMPSKINIEIGLEELVDAIRRHSEQSGKQLEELGLIPRPSPKAEQVVTDNASDVMVFAKALTTMAHTTNHCGKDYTALSEVAAMVLNEVLPRSNEILGTQVGITHQYSISELQSALTRAEEKNDELLSLHSGVVACYDSAQQRNERLEAEAAAMKEALATCRYYVHDNQPCYQFDAQKVEDSYRGTAGKSLLEKMGRMEEALKWIKEVAEQLARGEISPDCIYNQYLGIESKARAALNLQKKEKCSECGSDLKDLGRGLECMQRGCGGIPKVILSPDKESL